MEFWITVQVQSVWKFVPEIFPFGYDRWQRFIVGIIIIGFNGLCLFFQDCIDMIGIIVIPN